MRIKAIPRLRQDGQSWKEAEVHLDTKTWLPTAVKLTDPAGTRQTVYEFSEMKANAFDVIWWKDPFRVNLKGYKVEIIRADGNQQDIAAEGNQQSPVLPNLVGLPYTNAIAKLKTMGFTDDEIAKLRGGKAQDAADQLRIRARHPAPGTPLDQIAASVAQDLGTLTRAATPDAAELVQSFGHAGVCLESLDDFRCIGCR